MKHRSGPTMKRFSLYFLIFVVTISENPACAPSKTVRVSTFNIKELDLPKIMDVDSMGRGQNAQLKAAASIIQSIAPDILLINEIDHDYRTKNAGLISAAHLFAQNYLSHGPQAVFYPHVYVDSCNTGILTGIDLNNDGHTATLHDRRTARYAADCYGWGEYAGQFSMALYSKHPILEEKVRTFRTFKWRDLPGNHLPVDYYSGRAANILRLSSKSHWDIPVQTGSAVLHILASHPTPPAFDGPEDRNGKRNFDEIKFWRLYLKGERFTDDGSRRAGFPAGRSFVLLGDLNASLTGDTTYDGVSAIGQLLSLGRIQDTGQFVTSKGGLYDDGPGAPHYYERSTAMFGDKNRICIDYVLASDNIDVRAGGIYWPSRKQDPQGFKRALLASDHRLVWIDINALTAPGW